MARYTGPRVRISRRFGIPIFGNSKYLDRRNYPPGVHGPKSKRKVSDYAVGLIEKQKLRYFYGLQEKQFRNIYKKATIGRGVTGEKMLQILETRLDSVVYLSGFALTRAAARQMVGHGHILVNGSKVDVSSFCVKPNDTIEVRARPKSKQLAVRSIDGGRGQNVPGWILVDKDNQKAKLIRIPSRDEIAPIASEQAVVEFYSR
jgi:small subunit ribosomal protein S4